MKRTLFTELSALFARLQATIFLDMGIALANDYNLKDNYSLSILTGSLMNSPKLGTIEVALMKNGEFFSQLNGEPNYDQSCIGYISYSHFVDMLNKLSRVNSSYYELIFNKYKTYVDSYDNL
jgi:hypothetical protein